MANTKKTTTAKKTSTVKKTATKTPVKKVVTAKKTESKKPVAAKKVTKTPAKDTVKSTVSVATPRKSTAQGLNIDVFDLTGKATGKVALPGEIFGEKVNKKLLAQAVRVYLANKRQGTVSTKTRSEVDGSTRKIYRQKGTGRARHGSIRAPIFVHGGVVFGPKPREYDLSLPKKMRRKALFSALSAKLADGEVTVLSGLDAIEPKTKRFVEVLKKLGMDDKKQSMLIICPDNLDNVSRAARNVQGVTITAANRLNAYDVLKKKQLLFMKDAIDVMKKNLIAKE